MTARICLFHPGHWHTIFSDARIDGDTKKLLAYCFEDFPNPENLPEEIHVGAVGALIDAGIIEARLVVDEALDDWDFQWRFGAEFADEMGHVHQRWPEDFGVHPLDSDGAERIAQGGVA